MAFLVYLVLVEAQMVELSRDQEAPWGAGVFLSDLDYLGFLQINDVQM